MNEQLARHAERIDAPFDFARLDIFKDGTLRLINQAGDGRDIDPLRIIFVPRRQQARDLALLNLPSAFHLLAGVQVSGLDQLGEAGRMDMQPRRARASLVC